MIKKYELTGQKKEYKGRTLYRIRALKELDLGIGVGNVKKGDLGGWIQKIGLSLSHNGNSWVGEDAMVMDNATVMDDAVFTGDAIAKNSAIIKGKTLVCGHAIIEDNAVISEHALIYGDTNVKDCGEVCGYAFVEDMTIQGGEVIDGK